MACPNRDPPPTVSTVESSRALHLFKGVQLLLLWAVPLLPLVLPSPTAAVVVTRVILLPLHPPYLLSHHFRFGPSFEPLPHLVASLSIAKCALPRSFIVLNFPERCFPPPQLAHSYFKKQNSFYN